MSRKRTLLGYELSVHHDVIINYLVPSVLACVLYILLFASDVTCAFRHYKDENPIWGALTISFMYLPVLGSFIVIVSSWELWPKPEGYGRENVAWFLVKVGEHLFFPVWAMWRFAEKIFWSIEAYRAMDDAEQIAKHLSHITAPRNIELYFFFQGYVQALPQMLLQIHVLMTVSTNVEKQTADVQVLSLLFNLCRMAATTAFYQRFKTQKLAGKQYPWFKSYKCRYDPEVTLRRPMLEPVASARMSVVEPRPNTSSIEDNYDVEPSSIAQKRRSSDFYMEPSTSYHEQEGRDEVDRQTSIVDGPKRQVYRQTGFSSNSGTSQPDFNIRRLKPIKGMPEDDMAGKLVSFFWWFCFLLVRILALSAFAYFYKVHVLWVVLVHFVIVEAVLIYDAKTDEVKRAKAVFFLFIGLIYIFCIIEFKIKFKKTKPIYYGFFGLVYLENLVMCLVWWCGDVAELDSDFWFQYVFILIAVGSVLSLFSMLFYLSFNKPEKVVVGQQVL